MHTALNRDPWWAKRPGRPNRRRARAVALWLLAMFAGSQLALSWLVESGAPVLRDPEFYGRLARLRARQAEFPDRPLTLALGSSRTIMGLRPAALASHLERPNEPLVYNFGLIGAGPLLQRLALDRLLRHGIRPEQIVIEFWPPFFVETSNWTEESRIDASRLDRDDIDLLIRYFRAPDHYEEHWRWTRLVPTHQHRHLIMNLIRPRWLAFEKRQDHHWASIDDWGWKPVADQPQDMAPRLSGDTPERRVYEPLLRSPAPAPVAVQAFDDLLAVCWREGIAVTVVWLPEGSTFRSWYQPAAERWAAELLANYHARYGVRLIDARRWSPDVYLPDGFHLTPDGATAFTERFWAELSADEPGDEGTRR